MRAGAAIYRQKIESELVGRNRATLAGTLCLMQLRHVHAFGSPLSTSSGASWGRRAFLGLGLLQLEIQAASWDEDDDEDCCYHW